MFVAIDFVLDDNRQTLFLVEQQNVHTALFTRFVVDQGILPVYRPPVWVVERWGKVV